MLSLETSGDIPYGVPGQAEAQWPQKPSPTPKASLIPAQGNALGSRSQKPSGALKARLILTRDEAGRWPATAKTGDEPRALPWAGMKQAVGLNAKASTFTPEGSRLAGPFPTPKASLIPVQGNALGSWSPKPSGALKARLILAWHEAGRWRATPKRAMNPGRCPISVNLFR
jgi:hypothetical protein